MTWQDDPVGARLEADRKELLDLTLRNPLLNYRPRRRGIELVGESPDALFRMLVRDGRAMTFLPAPSPPPMLTVESAIKADGGPTEGPTEPSPVAEFLPFDPGLTDPSDARLQTALTAEALQARLLAIDHAARTAIEEQGVNSLHLALGMLHWTDDAAEGRTVRAPLLLIPVDLARSGARDRFRLRYSGGDLDQNLSLAEKLRVGVGLTLPALPEPDELDVAAYFDAVAALVADRPGWSVDRGAAALGFFSFGKFLMYRDLDGSAWPEGAEPSRRPLVRSLLGEGFAWVQPAVGDDEPVDPHVDPAQACHVVDADATQTLALLDAEAGRSFVIQGPPGTGKSQTITNLIAGALGRGRSVLFVAEKLAALAVVKRRLDAAGLGEACLELHSHATRKKDVLAALRRSLDLARPRFAPAEDDLRLLIELRDRLNGRCDALNAPIGASGVSPHEACGVLLNLRAAHPDLVVPPLDVPGLDDASGYDYRRRLDLVEQLRARLASAGVPRDHPFWGSRLRVLPPGALDRIRAPIVEARRMLAAVRSSAVALVDRLEFGSADGPEGVDRLILAAERLAEGRGLGLEKFRLDAWRSGRAELEHALRAGRGLAKLRRKHDATLEPGAWDQDLTDTRRRLAASGGRWWWFLDPRYWSARGRLARLCRGGLPATQEGRLELVDAVLAARRLRERLAAHSGAAADLLGPLWKGEATRWVEAEKVTEWVDAVLREAANGDLPPEFFRQLESGNDPRAAAESARELRALEAGLEGRLVAVEGALELDAEARFGPDRELFGLPFDEVEAALAAWEANLAALPHLAAFNHQAGVCRADGLGPVVDLAESWAEAPTHLATAFRRARHEALLARALRERPELAGFDAAGQARDVEAFAELDRRALRHGRDRLALEHWKGLPRHEAGGQLGVLRREFEKKTRHLPVRQLLARAGNAVRAIKPVFLMSPMSVAAYLAPGGPEFDLVVFDEASQVRPVDALGALARASQAIVVGDSRQLPPTSFFDRLIGGDGPGTDDPDDDDEASAGEAESILGLFVARGAPQRMLRWHYRSRHESLIAVSNREFYDGRLVVFPSPDAARSGSGLVLRHLPGTVYDRGGTRTNPGEAEAVARAAVVFAREQLGRSEGERLSLGVAAFGSPQAAAIRERLEALRRDEPDVEPFFAAGAAEPFFVKNLENVQGDERDVIFISVGYGRTEAGTVAMNFGPLNGEGGERRLNVLITRARVRCEVFSNLRATDLDPARSSSRGVRALRSFLAYAETGRLDGEAAPERGGDPEEGASAFVSAVRDALTGAGWEVRVGIGTGGARVDLAVVDPDHPGRFLAGIACDGPSYRSPRSARDRDRLRREVLARLGWRILPAWSFDWLRDPDSARAKLLEALDAARSPSATSAPNPPESPLAPRPAPAEETTTDVPTPEPGAEAEDEDEVDVAAGFAPYELAQLSIRATDGELHAVPLPRLAGWAVEVVRVEGPVHVDEVARRLADAAGVKRIGGRIQAALERAYGLAASRGELERRGAFLWPPGTEAAPPRSRAGLPSASRKLDLVAPEELAAAIERAVTDAFGLEPDAVPLAAARLLGFQRVGDDGRARLVERLEDLIAEGRLARQGPHVVVATPRAPE